MNVVRNAVWLFLLFAFVFGFGILWYIVSPIMTSTYNVSNSVAPSQTLDLSYINYLAQKTLIINGFYLVASVLVFFTLVSSVFDAQSFQGWGISAIGGLVITPIVIYVITTFWNTYATFGISFSEISNVFVENFAGIMFLNLIAGILSFIFIKKGQ